MPAFHKEYVLALVAAVAADSLRRKDGKLVDRPTAVKGDLVPPLDPRDHDEFFNKDYPVDEHPPRSKLGFKSVYPQLKRDDDFDEEVLDDSDSDGGAYDAQMNYDILRHRFGKEMKDVEVAKEKLKQEAKKLLVAQKEADAAQSSAEEAGDKADGIRAEVKEAEAEEEQVSKAVKKAKHDLAKAKKAMEKQQKLSRETKAELESLMKNKK
ncbi:unnamed protein product [Polarella glacialis]|uniref:Uncharacterized protein n=1 Tax=Polarella glacialis TaxID=89957 RepID=A0A813ETA4_POLGL|nr:unnamed protein product [Polarella glacialis]CAE8693029.1 unnamed protein product [Polarella glacialis]